MFYPNKKQNYKCKFIFITQHKPFMYRNTELQNFRNFQRNTSNIEIV